MLPDLRVKCYLLAAGLFDRPEKEASDFQFTLVARLARAVPSHCGCRPALEALERELLDEEGFRELRREYDRLFAPWVGKVPLRSCHWLPDGHDVQLAEALEGLAYLVVDDQSTRDAQRRAVRRLRRWATPLARRVLAESQHPRFRAGAAFLLAFLADEEARLDSDLSTLLRAA